MRRLTWNGTAEPVTRDRFLRRERGQGSIHFPSSADHEQDWQPYPVDPYSAICDVMTIHTFIHTYIHNTYIHTWYIHTYIHTYIHCRKGSVGPVAANSNIVEINKEAGGGAQGTLSLSKNCTSRESVSPLSRLIRGFRNKYH